MHKIRFGRCSRVLLRQTTHGGYGSRWVVPVPRSVEIARQWLAEHYPRGLRIVVEPAVPERWYWPVRDGRPQKRDRPQFVNELSPF